MKIIISENQYKRLFEQEQKVLHIPGIRYVGGWDNLQELIKLKGNPPYSISGDLDLRGTSIKSLGNLQSVGGYLDLMGTPISKMYSEKQIRQMVNVEGKIYL